MCGPIGELYCFCNLNSKCCKSMLIIVYINSILNACDLSLFIVSPVRMYSGGILWFSRRYAATSAFHRLHDNFKNPHRIASIFDM